MDWVEPEKMVETAGLGTGIAWYYWVLLTIRDKHNLVNMKTKFTMILICNIQLSNIK